MDEHESSTWTAGRIRELEQKLAAAELEIELRDGVLSMAVARLGGIVEGNPTGRHNFLQRIDELVAIEARAPSPVPAPEPVGAPPWDMPSVDRSLYEMIAAEPEKRTESQNLFKKYADMCFQLIETRDTLITRAQKAESALEAGEPVREKLIEALRDVIDYCAAAVPSWNGNALRSIEQARAALALAEEGK